MLLRKLAKGEPRPWDRETMTKMKNNTQKEVYLNLNQVPAGWVDERFRKKLHTWNLQGIQRHNAEAAAKEIKALGKVTPPRVHAAVLRTIHGRWLTKRRTGLHGMCIRTSCTCARTYEPTYVHKYVRTNFMQSSLGQVACRGIGNGSHY